MSCAAVVLSAALTLGAGPAAGSPDLSCTLYTSVSKLNVGQPFTVLARIFNSGDTDVNYVAPCPSWIMASPPLADCIVVTPEAGGAAVEVGAPQPQPQVTAYLTEGMTTGFTWSFLATATGAVDFSVSVFGREVAGPGMARSYDTVTLMIQNPAVLSATITTSSSGIVRYGDTVTLYLDVFNSGDAAADATIRFSITLGGAGRLTPLGCPPLATLCPENSAISQATIEHNSATKFTWLYRADGPGVVTVAATAAGVDHNAGTAVYSNSTATTFAVPVPSVLSYTVTGAEGVVQGELATYRVAVANLGATAVCQSAFSVRIDDGGPVYPTATLVLDLLGDSLLPICYEPGQVRTFTLQIAMPANLPPGPGSLAAVPQGIEEWGDRTPAIAVGSAHPLQVVAGRSGFCGFSDNPWRPRTGPVEICYAVAPGDAGRRVSVAVYTLAGELVRSFADDAKGTGVYSAVWDGRNGSGQRIASGIYLVFFQSYLSKDTRKLAVLQ